MRRPTTAELLRLLLPLLLVGALALAWRWGPMAELLGQLPDRMAELAARPGAPFLAVLVFVATGFAAVPISVLIVACASAFGALQGWIISWIGSLLSGLALFALGRQVGRRSFDSLAGDRGRRIAAAVARRGVIAVAILRNVPVAPYSVVNFAAGASPIRSRDFALGTALGLLPGLTLLVLVGDRLAESLRRPSAANLLLLAGALLALALLGIFAARSLGDPTDE